MQTRQCMTGAASVTSRIPPMPERSRERLWVRRVDLVRIPRGSGEENPMDDTTPEKPLLQNAAAESYSKAGADMKHAEPPLAKPTLSGTKLPKADTAGKKGSETPLNRSGQPTTGK